MKTRDEALELVQTAFLQARRKSGPRATSMTLAVLKNRLLQITDRRFNPKDFDTQDMKSFVALLSPDVVLSTEPPYAEVRLANNSGHSANQASDSPLRAAPRQAQARQAEGVPVRNGRIREDLWDAIMDYASGLSYVWDEQAGRARPSRAGEELPPMPTLTPIELAEWRHSFLHDHEDSLQGGDLASAQRWQEFGLPTTYLPAPLQQPWNREVVLRVRLRLQEFFSNLSSKVTSPVTVSTESSQRQDDEDNLSDLVQAAKNRGDGFTAGELLARQFINAAEDESERLFAGVVSAWAGSRGLPLEPISLNELSNCFDSFAGNNLATAFINALRRLDPPDTQINEPIRDFAFKLRDDISSSYGVENRSPVEMCRSALARLEDALAQGNAVVARFLRTTPATAKIASVDILKLVHRLQPWLVPAEREFLADLDVLIGPAFRKLFEAYERNENAEVLRRAPEYLENIRSHRPVSFDPRLYSETWQLLVQPVLDHLATLVEDATSRGEVALAPALSLRSANTKADLRATESDIYLSFSVRNHGKGHARDVSLQRLDSDVRAVAALSVVEPAGPFDVPPDGEQLVRLRLILAEPCEQLLIPIQWTCVNNLGNQVCTDEQLLITQQVIEPDWEALLAEPPYTLNPIKREDRLYGRNSTLAKLQLAAMAGTSTFVWGQKRIGKTSLLQVLASKLSDRSDTTCILLRMGELASLHEGQLAHRIAARLVGNSGVRVDVPEEAEFGAGISLLVPFVEKLANIYPDRKLVVIIDEFDDLDSAFYTGERGRQFMKGLRSASEAGLTFFFIGSERMDAIYLRHQADLNKWTNVRLDRIDSRRDCRALIEDPVHGAIEFDAEAIDFITDYTAGNPFYLHNFCYQIFERCLQEHRTFVDTNDAYAVRQQLLRSLGATNFSHFWEDNPVLDLEDKRREGAENCIALACISALGGRFESNDEIMEAQGALFLAAEDRATAKEIRRACVRLLRRGVLAQRSDGEGQVIALQIFREWLGENAKSTLLPVWIDYKEMLRIAKDNPAPRVASVSIADSTFPVGEDEMLAVAQKLIYCGKQKDVAEIKSWLRQFDDDGRIEMAFLLLRRIAERGFINEGMRALGMQKLEEMINAKRLAIGTQTWSMIKGRRDNLAIGYVDGEHKSGATTAREARAMLRPGKCTPAIELDAWMGTHVDSDAVVVIVDDFAGTGDSLLKGVRKFRQKVPTEIWGRYVAEKRVALFVMYAFPEALGAIRGEFPNIDVSAATVLGDELRACDEEARIFESESERVFAREVVQQIGRELSPSAPLGHGDMGALVVFHNAIPNNTLPIFWSAGMVGERPWKPLFPRA